MQVISQNLNPLSSYPTQTPGSEAAQVKQSGYLLQAKQSMDLTLYTTEGDKVTLSTASDFSASYASYNASGQAKGASLQVSAERYAFSQSSTATLTIEGDLSDAERADIRKALHEIGELTERFLRGKKEHSEERIGHIMELDSISSLEASMSYERNITALQAYAESIPPAGAATTQALQNTQPPSTIGSAAPEPLPVPSPTKRPPAVSTAPGRASEESPALPPTPEPEHPEGVDAHVEHHAPEIKEEGVRKLARKVGRVVDEAKIDRSKLMKHLFRFLDHFFKEVEEREDSGFPEHRVVEQVRSAIVAQLDASEAQANQSTALV